MQYRWQANKSFDMPIKVRLNQNEWNWIYPNTDWQEIIIDVSSKDFEIATHLFLIDVKKLK